MNTVSGPYIQRAAELERKVAELTNNDEVHWKMRQTMLDHLSAIAQVIEGVDNRAMACDGPVLPTRYVMTDDEMRRIYAHSKMDVAALRGFRSASREG